MKTADANLMLVPQKSRAPIAGPQSPSRSVLIARLAPIAMSRLTRSAFADDLVRHQTSDIRRGKWSLDGLLIVGSLREGKENGGPLLESAVPQIPYTAGTFASATGPDLDVVVHLELVRSRT